MKELHLKHGTIFDLPDNPRTAICITTNGVCKKDGTAVMGAGIAKAACHYYPGINTMLGEELQTKGNHVHDLGYGWSNHRARPHTVFSFPTKHHWKDNSDLNLITQSARELVSLCNQLGIEICYLPRPGCANGRLNWADVKAAIEPILDDRFIIVTGGQKI